MRYREGCKGPKVISEEVVFNFLSIHKTAALKEISDRATKKETEESAPFWVDTAKRKALRSMEAESRERLRLNAEKSARDADELAARLKEKAASARRARDQRGGDGGELEEEFAKQDAELERLRSHLDSIRVELDAQAARSAEANDKKPMCKCSIM